MNELPYWNNEACFVTLTYDNEHLPADDGLRPDDLQKFFKRLRKDLDGKKIKYYACGEYGDKKELRNDGKMLGRCHFHSIIFGVPYNKEGRELIKQNWTFCDPHRFDYDYIRHKEQGFAPCEPDAIRYVCGYVQKKYNGEKALEEYGERCPPFQRQSQGLGLQFALDNAELVRNNGLRFRGHLVGNPRYYVKKLGLSNPMESHLNETHRKVEWLQEHGFLTDEELEHYIGGTFSSCIDEKYASATEKAFNQYDAELRAKFDME